MQDQVVSPTQSGKYIPHPAEAGIYDNFIRRMTLRLDEVTHDGALQLFTTDTAKLYAAYLDSFSDPALRQYHNCHCCRQFIERFGGLVVIDAAGDTVPVMWDPTDAPLMYKAAVFHTECAGPSRPDHGAFHHDRVPVGNQPDWAMDTLRCDRPTPDDIQEARLARRLPIRRRET